MKIVIIDGQGGKIGSLLVSKIKEAGLAARLFAIGSNSIATAAMLKAGADHGATGENPVVINCRDADFIIGPIGIIAADALLGEITPAMAAAVSQSPAQKILLPLNRCNHYIVGVQDLPVAQAVPLAVDVLKDMMANKA